MTAFLAAAYAFVCAHGPAFITAFVLIAPTLITGLSSYPKAQGFVDFLKLVLNLLSVVSHKDSPGTFKAPFTVSKVPDSADNVVELVPTRGFSRIGTLLLLAVVSLLPLAARAADVAPPNPEAVAQAIAQDPAAVQPAPDPAPPAPKLGGCIRSGKVCFGLSASLSVAAINLRTHVIEPKLDPGLGYGVTFNPGSWAAFGFDAHMTLDPIAQQAKATVMLKAINGYFRFGYSKGFVGDTAGRLLFGSGFDL